MKKDKTKVKQIALPFWQDPQCYVVTQHVRDEVNIFCRCRHKNSEIITDKVGKIWFDSVLVVDIQRQITPYNPSKNFLRSAIYKVKNSQFLSNYFEKRQQWAKDNLNSADFRHFVVHSHDHQVNIIAKSYQADLIKLTQKNAYLKPLLVLDY